MKKTLPFLIMLFLGANLIYAQSVGINSDGSTPDGSAMLEVISTAKGFLAPRMTAAQKEVIASPAASLLIYQTDAPAGYYYNSGTATTPLWTLVGTGVANGSETKVNAEKNVSISGSGTTASPYLVNTVISITQVERDALTATEGLFIFNTTTHKPNYYNGTEWMNNDGTSATTFAIGVSYQGGIIAYILQPADPGYSSSVTHGIIAAPSDQSTGIRWDNGAFPRSPTIGTVATALGTGNANTNGIVKIQGTASCAARLCADLEINGYSDWFLPSRDELTMLYLNRVAISGFASGIYWSSSESTQNKARGFNFIDSTLTAAYYYKSSLLYVRAVRVF